MAVDGPKLLGADVEVGGYSKILGIGSLVTFWLVRGLLDLLRIGPSPEQAVQGDVLS
jgi:hypothetical protein